MRFREISVMFIVILQTHHCVELPDNACKASLDTLTAVSRCPSKEKDYIEAARRKNCSAYSNACRSFEYHCVLNEWTTSLVEVCAPSRLILSGKCTEFNRGLQCIRGSYLTDCKQFSKPCPPVYNSTQSFMYPGCYDTVSITIKQSTELSTSKYTTAGITIIGIRNQKRKLANGKRATTNQIQGHNENLEDVLKIALPITFLVVMIAVVVLIIACLKRKAFICNQSKRNLKRNQNTDASNNDTDDALMTGANYRPQSKDYK